MTEKRTVRHKRTAAVGVPATALLCLISDAFVDENDFVFTAVRLL